MKDKKQFISEGKTRPAARVFVTVCAALMMAAAPALSTPITNGGTAVLNAGNGAVEVSGNGITTGCIDWYNTALPPSGCQPSGTTGTFSVDGSSTAPFTVGKTGTIQDLGFSPPSPLVNFILVDLGGGNIAHFDLIGLRFNGATPIGDCTTSNGADGNNDTSPGAACTPPNSPFTIINGLANGQGVVNTVTVAMTLDAWGYTDTSGNNYDAANRYVGVFSTQGAVNGSFNIDSILQTIGSGGSVSASWSATLTPAVAAAPEPGTFFVAGLALITVASLRRRRRRI